MTQGDAQQPFVRLNSIKASGTDIDLAAIGTLLVVGPNSSGKSLLLRELFQELAARQPNQRPNSQIVGDLTLSTQPETSLEQWLTDNRPVQTDASGNKTFYTNEQGVSQADVEQASRFLKAHGRLWTAAHHVAAYLSTDSRLSQLNWPPRRALGTNDAANSAVERVALDEDLRTHLKEDILEAFGAHLIVDAVGQQITLRTSDAPFTSPARLTDENGAPLIEAVDAFSEHRVLSNEGDGMKAFTNIHLSLFSGTVPLALVDEPEAFMHPATAHILGRKMAAADTQVLASTHSAPILRGVLSAETTDLAILKLSRTNEGGEAHLLDLDDLKAIVEDPVLRHGAALEGLFHHAVVVVEGPGDASFFRAVLDEMPPSAGTFTRRDILFVAAGDKLRVAKIVKAMKQLHIPVAAIFDFDVFNDAKPLNETMQALDVEPADIAEIEKRRALVDEQVRSSGQDKTGAQILEEIGAVLSDQDRPPSNSELRTIRSLVRKSGVWSEVKDQGLSRVRGSAHKAGEEALEMLAANNIHVIEGGSLESFDRNASQSSKQTWLNQALENESHKTPVPRELITKACEALIPE